ncbi:hypothetical protein HON49_07935 [archaeon]|nr:hypothetical protein [archaeon]
MTKYAKEFINQCLDDVLTDEGYEEASSFLKLETISKKDWVIPLIRKLSTNEDFEYFNMLATDLGYSVDFLQEVSRAVCYDNERDSAVTAYKLIFERGEKNDYHIIAAPLMYNLGRTRKTSNAVKEIFYGVKPTQQLVDLFLSQQYLERGLSHEQPTARKKARNSAEIIVECFGIKAIDFVTPESFDEIKERLEKRLEIKYRNSHGDAWIHFYSENIVKNYITRVSKIRDALEQLSLR